MVLVLDTSIYLDRFVNDVKRKEIAQKLLELTPQLTIYEPRVFLIELTCVLGRKSIDIKKFVKRIENEINIINEEEIYEIAKELAPKIHGRAIDLYFIATAQKTSSILITNDKTQANNAKKADIETYYLIEEFKFVFTRINQEINKNR